MKALHHSAKVQIISRYVPIANRAGHFTYLLELMRYLHAAGFSLELDVLDPWFLPENIPDEIHDMAQVVLMPTAYIEEESTARTSQMVTAKHLLRRALVQTLPPFLLGLLRQYWYRWRGQNVPGHHAPDAAATEAEIAFVAERLQHVKPDVLIANESFLGNLLSLCPKERHMLKVSVAFDVQHQRQQCFQHINNSQSQPLWSREKETELLSAADLIVAIHKDEADTFRAMLPQAEVICVPMASEVRSHREQQQIAGRCLFVGSNIVPNVQGLQWFLRDVWPGILQQRPSVSLHVCGTVCEQFSRSYPQVSFLGRVESLEHEYAEAELCIIPLIAGSGLKIKLVEALSHGRACVSTSVGVQGVHELEEKAVLVADEPEAFAKAMITILKDENTRHDMELEAKLYVTENLSPENVYRPFIKRIEQHLIHSQIPKNTL